MNISKLSVTIAIWKIKERHFSGKALFNVFGGERPSIVGLLAAKKNGGEVEIAVSFLKEVTVCTLRQNGERKAIFIFREMKPGKWHKVRGRNAHGQLTSWFCKLKID